MNLYFREASKMLYECDNKDCMESSEFFGNFKECVQEAKQEGWKSYQIDGEWSHDCPLCAHGSKPKDPREVFG